MVKFLNRFQVALALTMTAAAVALALTVGGLPAASCGISAVVCWVLCD